MAKPYYTLLSLAPDSSRWLIEFGDYSRSCVVDERNDMKGAHNYVKRTVFKIIKTQPGQCNIDAKVAALNVKTAI
jgi:hypothetical protein